MRELLWLMRARHAAGAGGVAINIPPRLDAVSPTSGTTAGGTTLTLTGNSFDGRPLSVSVGGAAATSVTRVSATQVTCVTPAGVAGAADVAISTPGGTATRSGAFTYLAGFDPTTLSWNLLQRGSYGGSPWSGTASAGSSGSRSLTGGTAPSVGAAQNGLTPADFNGTTQQLTTSLAWSSLVSASQFFFDIIVLADTTSATSGSFDADTNVIGDVNGFLGVAFTNSGLTITMTDGTLKTVTVAAGTGSYQRFQARLASGGILSARVNGGSWSTLGSVGSISSIADTALVGRNYNATRFLDGRLLHLGISSTAFSDSVADAIEAANRARYGL